MEEFLRTGPKPLIQLASDSQTQASDKQFLRHAVFWTNYVPQNKSLGERVNAFDLDVKKFEADLLAEIDRKVDDGAPRTGSFRFTPLMATGIAPVETTCTSTSATPIGWLVAGSIDGNCAGAQLF